MGRQSEISRRVLVAGIATTPVLSTAQAEVSSPDAELIGLGDRFEQIVRALEDSDWADDEYSDRFADVERSILSAHATTIDGLCVKSVRTADPKAPIRLSLSSIRPSIGADDPIPEEMDYREIAIRVAVMDEV